MSAANTILCPEPLMATQHQLLLDDEFVVHELPLSLLTKMGYPGARATTKLPEEFVATAVNRVGDEY